MIRNYYTESASCRFRVMGVHVYAQVISLRALIGSHQNSA